MMKAVEESKSYPVIPETKSSSPVKKPSPFQTGKYYNSTEGGRGAKKGGSPGSQETPTKKRKVIDAKGGNKSITSFFTKS